VLVVGMSKVGYPLDRSVLLKAFYQRVALVDGWQPLREVECSSR
jgi:hypothetical protein